MRETSKTFMFYSDKLNYKTVEAADGTKRYYIGGHISTGDLDLVNDIVTKECMDSMISQFDMRMIKLDFEHEAFIGNSNIDIERAKTRIPLGKALNKKIDKKGVYVEWELNSDWKKFDEKGNITYTFEELWRNIESGYYDAYSIAYIPTRTRNIDRGNVVARMLDDIKLLNVALTGNAINPYATINSIMAKSLNYLKSQEDIIMNCEEDLVEIKSSIADIAANIKQLKNKMGERMENTNGPASNTVADPEGKGTQAPTQPQNAASAATVAGGDSGDTVENKAIMANLKSQVEQLVIDVKAIKEENANLKSIVEQARLKATGSDNATLMQQKSAPMINDPLQMFA